MSDETPKQMPVGISELIPSQIDQVSGIGSQNAPFLYVDWIGAKGISNNVVAVTLEATRLMTVGTGYARDRVVVGHLRMSLETMRVLQATLKDIELAAQPAASAEKN